MEICSLVLTYNKMIVFWKTTSLKREQLLFHDIPEFHAFRSLLVLVPWTECIRSISWRSNEWTNDLRFDSFTSHLTGRGQPAHGRPFHLPWTLRHLQCAWREDAYLKWIMTSPIVMIVPDPRTACYFSNNYSWQQSILYMTDF